MLTCTSSRRSASAGSAWVAASARSYSGSASVRRPCTEVTSAIMSSAQPMAQLSSASDAASSALAATWPAFSGSPKLLCVRAASTSSRARCRAESPGEASAWSSVARDFGEPALPHPALDQCPVQVHQQIGLDSVSQGHALATRLGPGSVTDPVESVGQPGG